MAKAMMNKNMRRITISLFRYLNYPYLARRKTTLRQIYKLPSSAGEIEPRYCGIIALTVTRTGDSESQKTGQAQINNAAKPALDGVAFIVPNL